MSLHLGLLCWNVTLRLEHIFVWKFMVQCCGNGSWCCCINKRIWNNHKWYSENWLEGSIYAMLQALSFLYIVYVGPWVLGWKSIKPSRKTLRCGCMGLVLLLGMSPKRHGVWLALRWCPRIVIIILIEYPVEHWYMMCRLVGVSNLLVVKGWMRKMQRWNQQTHAYMFDMITHLLI